MNKQDIRPVFIGDVKISPPVALAPMAGVTDVAFRHICREKGAGLSFTEMVSSKALFYGDKKTEALLRLSPLERPAGVQIFGSDPECMAYGAVKALSISGADFLDINCGCPTLKIVSNGDGCALMRDMRLAERVISAVCRAVSRPVTVKFRKGWDSSEINAVEFAKMAESCGAAAVCVHGRTKKQLYSGKADWDIIRDVKRSVSVPVIANGDIVSAESALKALGHTGADIVMVGRAAFGNPWIFRDILSAMTGEAPKRRPSIDEICETALSQFALAREQKGEHVACLEARKHYAWYLRGIPHAGFYREQISSISCFEDIEKLTKGIKRDLTVPSEDESASF